MKVAIVTMDGNTVSQHFGRSPYYRIITIENGQITGDEIRQRGTGHFARQGQASHQHHHHDNHSGGHGTGPEARSKHAAMAQEISDCDILVAGGMGSGAYQHFTQEGLKVYLTDLRNIEDVVIALIKGELKNLANERTD